MQEPISVRDLELQYDQQKAEYQQTQNKVNRLEATKDLNVKEFITLYNKLSPTIKKTYNLTLEKPPEEMTLEELIAIKGKVTDAYNDVASKLQSYLRTGKTETISNLLPQSEPNPLIEVLNDVNQPYESSEETAATSPLTNDIDILKY